MVTVLNSKNDLRGICDSSRLYSLQCGKGYSTLGFDYAFNLATKIAAWCGVSAPNPENVGKEEGYAEYLAILQAAGEKAKKENSRCNVELTSQLLGLENKRVEVVDKYGETRRFIVGKSTGWLPIHLEIKRKNSSGGGSVTGAPFKSVRIIHSK